MPLEEFEQRLIAAHAPHLVPVLKKMVREAKGEYGRALGSRLCSEPDSFDLLEHKAQLRAFGIAQAVLNKAANLAPEDEESDV